MKEWLNGHEVIFVQTKVSCMYTLVVSLLLNQNEFDTPVYTWKYITKSRNY